MDLITKNNLPEELKLPMEQLATESNLTAEQKSKLEKNLLAYQQILTAKGLILKIDVANKQIVSVDPKSKKELIALGLKDFLT